jgi:hypothetical protein
VIWRWLPAAVVIAAAIALLAYVIDENGDQGERIVTQRPVESVGQANRIAQEGFR